MGETDAWCVCCVGEADAWCVCVFPLQTILQKGILLERDALRLMSCVGQVLSILPIPDIMNYLDAILVPRLEHMQQLVKQEVSQFSPMS